MEVTYYQLYEQVGSQHRLHDLTKEALWIFVHDHPALGYSKKLLTLDDVTANMGDVMIARNVLNMFKGKKEHFSTFLMYCQLVFEKSKSVNYQPGSCFDSQVRAFSNFVTYLKEFESGALIWSPPVAQKKKRKSNQKRRNTRKRSQQQEQDVNPPTLVLKLNGCSVKLEDVD